MNNETVIFIFYFIKKQTNSPFAHIHHNFELFRSLLHFNSASITTLPYDLLSKTSCYERSYFCFLCFCFLFYKIFFISWCVWALFFSFITLTRCDSIRQLSIAWHFTKYSATTKITKKNHLRQHQSYLKACHVHHFEYFCFYFSSNRITIN